MVEFHTLSVKNFRSIEEAHLVYKTGVWETVGINNDTKFTSNASGKSTINAALQQCLFNRSMYGQAIEDCNRRYLDHVYPYELSVTFSVDGEEYEVQNSRKTKTLRLLHEGQESSIRNVNSLLKTIATLLGMDFHTFVTLTYITTDNISDLIDNFSSSSLMKVILNFQKLQDYAKRLRQQVRLGNTDIKALQDRAITIENSLRILNKFEFIDLIPMNAARLEVMRVLEEFSEDTLVPLYEQVDQLSERLQGLELRRYDYQEQLDGSVCKCCGSELRLTADQRLDITSEITRLDEDLLITEERYKVAEERLAEARKTLIAKRETYTAKLQLLDGRIMEAKTKNKIYEDSQEDRTNLQKELHDVEAERKAQRFRIDLFTTTLEILKTGEIHKDLLTSFTTVLNMHLERFIDIVEIDYLTLSATAKKDSIEFSVYDSRFNVTSELTSLSGGEKTRIRLIILLSMLATIKDLTQYSTNILVFDESLDSLDKSATEDLRALFTYLTTNDRKFISLISHGGQLQDVELTGRIIAEKTDGKTVITTEEYL